MTNDPTSDGGTGFSVLVPAGYDEAVIQTRLALRAEGFSILSEMHVGGLLGPQAGSSRQYLFMGVWNGALEQRRLDSELQVAVHLPCNVVIQEDEEGALVAALDPADDIEHPQPEAIAAATAARGALLRMLGRIGTAA